MWPSLAQNLAFRQNTASVLRVPARESPDNASPDNILLRSLHSNLQHGNLGKHVGNWGRVRDSRGKLCASDLCNENINRADVMGWCHHVLCKTLSRLSVTLTNMLHKKTA